MPDKAVYPRPEYPRPDFQRGTIEGKDWINLNGPWQFRFDGDRRGLSAGWHLPNELDWREQIVVPFCWESLAAWGEGETASNENYYSTRVFKNPLEINRANHTDADRYEVGWYRRRITVPNTPDWEGKRIILKVGAADFFTDCWCNGVHVGHHEGGYDPFEFDITDALQRDADGRASGILVMRVEDPMDNHEQPVGKQWHWYTPTSGIWQTVYLEPRESAHIEHFRITPDFDARTVTFEVDCRNAGDDCQLVLFLMPPADEVKVFRVPVAKNAVRHRVEIPHPYAWTPEQPFLYKVAFKLNRADKSLDYVQSYFGIRKIDSGPSEDPKAPAVLRLNNTPIYLRGALYQSYHPDGVYTASDVAVLKQDIEAAKRFGFNFLRVHIKIDDPLLLYYADSIGMMLMCDFPNFGEGGDTPTGRRRFEQMMRAAVRRDFNHPAIIAWCVFNETWGFGGQIELIKHFPDTKEKILPRRYDAGVRAPGAVSASGATEPRGVDQEDQLRVANLGAHSWVRNMWQLAKSLDATRLVEDMSVVHWEHLEYFAHGDTDINSWHFYIDDYDKAKQHIDKVVNATYSGSTFNYVPGYQQTSQPLINSEYGGVGALDGNRDASWSFKFLTNELRRHGQISAYIYTELHDVEWEYNGFLAYDRTPKDFGFDPVMINQADVLPMDAPPIGRHKPGAVVKIPVSSSHFSPLAQDKVYLRWRLGGMDTWARLHQDLATGLCKVDFPHRRVAAAHTIELRMPDRPMLCTLDVEAVTVNGDKLAANFIHFFVSDGPQPPREETERSLVLRAFPHQWAAAEWTGAMSSKDAAENDQLCFGVGHGFFEWTFDLDKVELRKARRLRVIFEASSRRLDEPQTSADHFPTTVHARLNGVEITDQAIINHPHDARGALSYLGKGKGAYGYLISTAIEGEMLRKVARAVEGNQLRLRCSVDPEDIYLGGLTIYGPEAGRYPIGLLAIIEW